MRGSTAGLADAFDIGDSKHHRRILTVIDISISCGIIAPAVVGYWRGIWNLAGIYVYPDEKILSSLVSVIVGLVGHITFTLAQDVFRNLLHPDKSRLVFYISSRIYTYIFGVVSVNSWRGSWLLLERLFDVNGGGPAVTAVSLVALAVLRCFRNITTTPFALTTDKVAQYFDVPTMFRISNSREPFLYILDCLFSVVVIGSLVVFVWRGVWDLLDIYLFPENLSKSAWASFIIGYGLALVTFLLQGTARRACTKLKGAQRLIVADLFLLLSFIATINIWRSVWTLLDIYFLPENPALSNIITHVGCFILLMLLNCANSVLVRGVYIDAEEEGGQCVVFPCYYIRLFFQKERLKKMKKRLESESMEKADADITGAQSLLLSKTQGVNQVVIVKSTTAPNHIVVHLPEDTNGKTEKSNDDT